MKNSMKVYSTNFCGDRYAIRANFAQASCSIERETYDGWEATGMQVADFSHDPESAMMSEINDSLAATGSCLEEFQGEITDAINTMS